MNQQATPTFSQSEARRIVADLFEPRSWIYWTDFSVSYGLGIAFFALCVHRSQLIPASVITNGTLYAVCLAIACVCLYRSVIFIHELVHLRPTGRLLTFRIAWNLLCGIPLLVPSFTYFPHIEHHRRKHFGTDHDGEYLPLARESRWKIVLFLVGAIFVPLLAVIRFALLTPLAWLIPGVRPFVHKHASSLVMDPSYIRPLPTKQVRRIIWLQEFCCFAWCVATPILGQIVLGGELFRACLINAYIIAVCIIVLNNLRTLGAHRWHNDGSEMSIEEQLLDSVNYPHFAWIAELWGPVGLRFHALHHLFPSMPYHSLPTAHRRLMEQLPQDSIYRQTVEPSLLSGVARLWSRRRNTDYVGNQRFEGNNEMS